MHSSSRAPSLNLALLSLCLTATVPALAGASAAISAPLPEPEAIHGGQVASACAWPTAVAVTGGSALCTGTLVHPRLVMYAAHCGGGNKKVVFGEDVGKPKKTVQTEVCMTNPDYNSVDDQETDWAFCRLAEAVTDVPTTPVTYGCETEIVYDGQTVAVTGFGLTTQNGSAGIKNWGLTPIHQVFTGSANVGGIGDPGICPGDSGGPAFVRYPDGSWHTFGIASTLTGECGGIGTHSLAWNAVPWIEENSGIDITPCHDIDGTWNPTHLCTGFYAGEPGVGVGEWTDWCPGTVKNASSATCGKAFDAEPDNAPPVVTITTPISTTLPDMNIFTTAIEVDADDGDGWGVVDVRIKINGQEQPLTDEQAPYAFATVNFPKGSWELIAVATDAAGLVGESEPVILHVGMEAPAETTDGPLTGGDTEPTTGAPTSSDAGSGGGEGDPTDPTATTTATAATTPGNGDSGDTGDTAPAEGADDGCGCRGSSPTPSSWLLLLALAGLRRRRARAH